MSATSSQDRRAARRHEKYWATQRTNLALCEASPLVSGAILHAIRQKLREVHDEGASLFLGLSNLNGLPNPCALAGIRPEMKLEEKKAALGIEQPAYSPTNEEQILSHWLRAGQKRSQANWWNFRAGEAARFYGDLGWFPFFVTLTVDPKQHDALRLFKERKAWPNYINKLARISARECGVTGRDLNYISDRDYLAYFAQLEHGKSGHHHHVHALIWFRDIPKNWKRDPNWFRNSEHSVNRRCPPLESQWQYCAPDQRPAIYFWYASCPWQRIGHKTPIDEKTGKGLKLYPPENVGGYLSKYMSKEDKPWHHHVKSTRNLGMERVTRCLKQMTTRELIQLALQKNFDQRLLLQTTLTAPEGLMRCAAKSEIYCRTFQRMNFKELTEPKPKPFRDMQESVNSGHKPWRMPLRECSRWLQDVLPDEKIEFCERDWFSALRKLAQFDQHRAIPIHTIGGVK